MKTVQYSCVNCGAQLEFRASGQDFHCKYCDSTFTSEQMEEIFPESEFHALDLEEPKPTEQQEQENLQFAEYNALYSCPSCGAAVVTEKTTSATKCVYCHSPVVLSGRLSGEYKPSKVIPFKVTQEAAQTMLKNFCAKKWFIPSDFKSATSLSEMQAIYIPYWVATCSVSGRISGRGTKVRTWRSGNYRYTETQEYAVVREGSMIMNRVPADASSKADDTLMQSIEPFDYGGLKEFKMSYLTGYLAQQYDVKKEDVYPKIRERAKRTAESTMRGTIHGYTTLNITQNTIDVDKTNWEHYLMPVWFLTYKYKDRDYFYAINGQTGKYNGNLPIVWGKVLAMCGGLTAVITTLISLLMGGM